VVGLGASRDFFISYTAVNQPWAEWIAVTLERADYTTVLQAWDFAPGSDFVHRMQQATSSAARTIAVLSPAYFGSRFGEAEWRAAFAKDPSGERGLLVPVRVQPCEPPGLLVSRVYIDLVELDETTARQRLLAGVKPGDRPDTAPFPGTPRTEAEVGGAAGGRARFPGLGPRVSNLPPRNRHFSGRRGLLQRLHADLQADAATAVLPVGAVHGLGGVGKTQLALEFAHRFGSDYDVIWWVPAEQPTAAAAELAKLAGKLDIPVAVDQSETLTALFDQLRGRGRWLLIYDNAEQPDQLAGLLPPGGGGHVLVTSRWPAWGSRASSLRLNVLSRAESVAFLRRRTSAKDEAKLVALADLLGDLPLALEEAAAYLEETGDDLSEYLELVRDRGRELFGLDNRDPDQAGQDLGGDPQRDQRRVASVWSVSLDRVHSHAPAAEALLGLAAFLAPEIPRGLPTEQPQVLPPGLAAVVGDRLAYNRTLAAIGRYSLAAVTADTIGLHRLVQAVIQARLGEAGEREWAETAVALLRECFPDDSVETRTWPDCARLLPHLLAATGHAERLWVAQEAAGWLLGRAAAYLQQRGQYRQALPLAERGVALTEAALGPDDVEVGWRRDILGRVLLALGNVAGARNQVERALQIGEAALGPDHPDVGTWRCDLGVVLHELGDLTGARDQFERALQISEAALGPDHPDIGTRRNNLGLLLYDLRDLTGARDESERALQIGRATLGSDHPEVGNRRGNLGRVLHALGDLSGARNQFEQALQISEAALGPDHPDVGWRRGTLGLVLLDLGDLSAARDQLERALQITEAALGPDHWDVGIRWANLGLALRELGDLSGARDRFERALQIMVAALGPDQLHVGNLRGVLGDVLWNLGNLPGAREQLERALQIMEAALGRDHPTIGTWRNSLGLVLRELGDLSGARAQFERTLQITEGALGPDHPDVGTLRGNLASVLQDLGDIPGARAQFERALQITEAAQGPDHPNTLSLMAALSQNLTALDEHGAARDVDREILRRRCRSWGEDHPESPPRI
jgi:tetratricopeptide (TPR) repeat protein